MIQSCTGAQNLFFEGLYQSDGTPVPALIRMNFPGRMTPVLPIIIAVFDSAFNDVGG